MFVITSLLPLLELTRDHIYIAILSHRRVSAINSPLCETQFLSVVPPDIQPKQGPPILHLWRFGNKHRLLYLYHNYSICLHDASTRRNIPGARPKLTRSKVLANSRANFGCGNCHRLLYLGIAHRRCLAVATGRASQIRGPVGFHDWLHVRDPSIPFFQSVADQLICLCRACLSSVLSLYYRVLLNQSLDLTWHLLPVITAA